MNDITRRDAIGTLITGSVVAAVMDVTRYSPHDDAVHTYWSSDHTQNLAWGTLLLVMDMYEHAYQMDYGANAKGYVDAFFQNLKWDEVNRRAEDARSRK